MAQRRMFSLAVVDTDSFLDLPASSQCLYFHLGMRADDDGFVASPKKITAMVNCSTDDLKLLIAKGFVIPFESGVCVIRDWKLNNYIQSDRYHQTRYLSEKQCLTEGASGGYMLMDTSCIQNVSNLDTEVRKELAKSKVRKEKNKADKPPRKKFVPPSLEEISAYVRERGSGVDPKRFYDYYDAAGWVDAKGNPVRNWKQKLIMWERGENDGQRSGNNSGHAQQSAERDFGVRYDNALD